jgi:predicted nucleic acid-binding protein
VTVSISSNHFWDSCVLIRFLTAQPNELVDDIGRFLDEAIAGRRRIYMSTMVIAEIKPFQLQQHNYDNFQELLDAIQSAFVLIAPSVPINMLAAQLQNHQYRHDPPAREEKNRVLSGMDAVHLATCLHVRDQMRVRDIEFHTFDDGRGGNARPRGLSLLSYQDYAQHLRGNHPEVQAICDLPRLKPVFPNPAGLA